MTPIETEAIVVMCTVPAGFDSEPLARDLVQRSLAACVQMLPGVVSIYQWKGSVEKSPENLLLIKTRRGRFAEIEAAIRALHPYDVPEIVALPVSDGHAPYLAWVASNTA